MAGGPLFAVLVLDKELIKKLPARHLFNNGEYGLLFDSFELEHLLPDWVPFNWRTQLEGCFYSLSVNRIQKEYPDLFGEDGSYNEAELAEDNHSLFLWDSKLFEQSLVYWDSCEQICKSLYGITNFRTQDPLEYLESSYKYLHCFLNNKVALFDKEKFCASLQHIPYDYTWNLRDGLHARIFKKILDECTKEEHETEDPILEEEDSEIDETQTDTVCDSDDVYGVFEEESSNKLTNNMEYTTNKKMQLTEDPGTPCSYTYTVSKLIDVEFEEDREWDAKITIGYSIKELKNSKNKCMHRIYFKLDHVLFATYEITPVSQMFKTFVLKANDVSGANALQAVYMLCREKLIGLCNSRGFANYTEFSQCHRKFDAFAQETLNSIHAGILADYVADSEHTYVNDNYDE